MYLWEKTQVPTAWESEWPPEVVWTIF